jgi:hypothetical protein
MAKQGRHAKHGKQASGTQKGAPANKSSSGAAGKAPHHVKPPSHDWLVKPDAKVAKKIARALRKGSPKIVTTATREIRSRDSKGRFSKNLTMGSATVSLSKADKACSDDDWDPRRPEERHDHTQ